MYASWSTGYTPPLLSTITASNGTVNTDLKPEKAVQYEIGAQGTLIERLTGQVALFDMDNTNKLVTQSVAGVNSTVNVGEQRDEGAELVELPGASPIQTPCCPRCVPGLRTPTPTPSTSASSATTTTTRPR